MISKNQLRNSMTSQNLVTYVLIFEFLLIDNSFYNYLRMFKARAPQDLAPPSPRFSTNFDNLQLTLMSQQKGKTSLAYARLGKTSSKLKPSDDTNPLCDFQQSPPRNDQNHQPVGCNIYDQILHQMAHEHNKYISGLVLTHSHNRLGKSLTKQRKLSTYKANIADDDELLYAASARQLGGLKVKCMNAETNTNTPEQRFNSSRQNSQRSNSQFFGGKKQVVTTNFQTPREREPEFIAFLDSYVSVLSGKKGAGGGEWQQRSKDAEREQVKLTRKLEMYEKKFKEMQLSNHMEVKKLKKREVYMRGKLEQLQEHVSFLTTELQRQRQQRRKLQNFFNEFKTKLTMIRSTDKKCPSKYSNMPHPFQLTDPDLMLDSFDQYSSTSSFQDNNKLFSQCPSSLTSKNSGDSRNKKSNNFFKTKREVFGKMGEDLDISNENSEYL